MYRLEFKSHHKTKTIINTQQNAGTWKVTQLNEPSRAGVERILMKMEKALSIKRRHPFERQYVDSYDNYILNFMSFVQDNRSLIEDLFSGKYDCIYRSLKNLRILVKRSSNTPINEIIELGMLPKFLQFLQSSDRGFQLETSWLMTNVTCCSTMQTRLIIESGVVEALVRLLWSDCSAVKINSAWALGNVAGDVEEFRDYVISRGAIPGVLHVLGSLQNDRDMLGCAWVLENLCNSGRQEVVTVIPVLRDYLLHSSTEFVCKCVQILTCMSFRSCFTKEIVNNNLLPYLVEFLYRQDDLLHYTLQILANIAAEGDDYLTQSLLDINLFSLIGPLLNTNDVAIRRHVCLIINNIANGSSGHIQSLTESGILLRALKQLHKSADEKIHKYVANALRNTMRNGPKFIISYFNKFEVVKELCLTLTSCADGIFYSILCCLETLLESGEAKAKIDGTINEVAEQIEECGGLRTIESLLSHEVEDAYLKAYNLIERYFCNEESSNYVPLEDTYRKFLSV